MEIPAYSVVINVEPDPIQTMLLSIYLYGNLRTFEKPYWSSPLTEYQKCWAYGHVKPLCKAESPTCPLCSLQHTQAEHRYPNPSCASCGNAKAILNCCLASPARCSNFGEAHSAKSGDCPERHPPTNSRPAPAAAASLAPLDPDQKDVRCAEIHSPSTLGDPTPPDKASSHHFRQKRQEPPAPHYQPLPSHSPANRLSLVRCRTTARSLPHDSARDTLFP